MSGVYFIAKKIKPIKYINPYKSTQGLVENKPKKMLDSIIVINAILKSSFLLNSKLITLPFIKVFIPMVAPTIQTINIASDNVGTKISVVSVILFMI